jgi:hypothetical protein
VLRDKARMTTEWRLLAVIRRRRRREALFNKLTRMFEDGLQTIIREIGAFARTKPKPPPEWRFLERFEELIDVSHGSSLRRVQSF